jgi:DNA-binding MarR family transcriptional regulator
MKAIWEDVGEELKERFGLEPATPPEEVIRTTGQKKDGWFGGRIKKGRLVTDEHDVPLEGVVARSHMASVLKKKRVCSQCIEDLSNAFAAQRLGGDQQSDWFAVWHRCVGRRDIGSIRNYYPAEMFRLLQYLQGNHGLEDMIHQFLKWKQSGLRLTNENYVTHISENYRRWSREFDATEIQMIEHLMEEPSITMRELAEHVGVSYKWISRKKNEMLNNYVLNRQDFVPYSKVGIHFVFLLIGKNEDTGDPMDYVVDSPFFLSYRRILSGEWSLLALLTVPENTKSMRALEEFTKILRRKGRSAQLFDTAIAGYPRCYDFYSVRRGRWEIPWDILKHELVRIHKDGLADIIPRTEKPIERIQLPLDRLDMDILAQIFKRNTSVRAIRKELHIGQNRAHTRLKRLKENGLIERRWSLRHIGLNECVYLICRDLDLSQSIASWVQRLPYCQVQFTTDGELILAADLPEAGAYGFARAINQLSADVMTGILGHSITKDIEFPKNLWDEETQNWLCPEESIRKWFMSVQ